MALFAAAPAAAVFQTVIFPCIYASLEPHTLDLNIEVLNLIWLLVLYVPRDLSFISTQFFVLNLVGWVGALSKKFIIFWYSSMILL